MAWQHLRGGTASTWQWPHSSVDGKCPADCMAAERGHSQMLLGIPPSTQFVLTWRPVQSALLPRRSFQESCQQHWNDFSVQ